MFDFKPFTFLPKSSFKEKLLAVLDYLENLIKEILREEEPSRNLFKGNIRRDEFWSQVIDGEVLAMMRSTWLEIRMRIEKERSRLGEMNDDVAYSHGLSGSELDLKLEMITWASRELVSATQKAELTVGPRKSKRIISLVKKNFEIIEVIIGSILEATGAKTALKEIVKLFTHSFKDFNKK